ncbi:MAG: sigma-70 family RNA polymerase sigma factor [Oscillospiraceae bacterium]|nr:sigma-70 family RNA polymerase sigma factor [Oscillospiraceae bacterium]
MDNLQLSQIEKARTDDATLAMLISRQMPMINRLASAAICPGLDFDDAVQEGIIGFFSAIATYSPHKSASFKTYANVCVQNAIASAVRAASRKKHQPLNFSVPLEEDAFAGGPEQLAIEQEGYKEAVRRIEAKLSDMEMRVLTLHLSGQRYAQIAQRLDIDEKAVDNALSRIRRKLR